MKITTPNDMATFVVGCYILHHDSNFYTCLGWDKPFLDLEEDIVHFKSKGEVIVMGDMNAFTKTLQSDTQQIDMPCFSRQVFVKLIGAHKLSGHT